MIERVEIFIAYDHADEPFRSALEKHLITLKRQGFVTDWHNQEILPGQEWRQEVHKHLTTAQIILLLVSQDFLASEYSYGVELKTAMERHKRGEARVIPVIVRYADWENGPLGELQALPPGGKPVTSWPDQDQAFLAVAKAIRDVVENMRGISTIPSTKVYEDDVPLERARGIQKASERLRGATSSKKLSFHKKEREQPFLSLSRRPRYLLRYLAIIPLLLISVGLLGIGAVLGHLNYKTPHDVATQNQSMLTVPPTAQPTAGVPGLKWNSGKSGTRQTFYKAIWAASRFVVVGTDGAIVTSPDGKMWTPQNSHTSNSLNSIAWSSSRSLFVVVGSGGVIVTSPDGIRWTPQNSHTSSHLRDVIWADSRFLAVGDYSTFVTSSDGKMWTPQISYVPNTRYALAWSDSRSLFVAVENGGVIVTSPDGIRWTPQNSHTENDLRDVIWVDSRFLALGFNGTILTSFDGIRWTSQNSRTSNNLDGITESNSLITVVGDKGTILVSSNASNWNIQHPGSTEVLYSVAASDSLFVAVGKDGAILTST